VTHHRELAHPEHGEVEQVLGERHGPTAVAASPPTEPRVAATPELGSDSCACHIVQMVGDLRQPRSASGQPWTSRTAESSAPPLAIVGHVEDVRIDCGAPAGRQAP
jgi:hypothetical protein